MTPKEKDQLLKLRRRRLTSHFDKLGYKCAWGPDWLDFEGDYGLVRVSWAYLDPNAPDKRTTLINGMPVEGRTDERAIMSWLKPDPIHEGF